MALTRGRAWLANLALALASLCVCLLLLEVAARLVEWQRVGAARQAIRTGGAAMRFHPVLGWEKAPGATLYVKRSEFEVVMHMNSHGLRGPERDYACPSGTRRVLVIGDSFAAGYYVNDQQTLAAVLERLLSDTPCGSVQVLNGGTGGYSTDQEYLFYKIEGQRYEPRVVVLMLYYNDLLYNIRDSGSQGEPKPCFDLADGELEPRNVPLTPPARPGSRVGEDVERISPWRGSLALRLLGMRTSDSAPRLNRWLAALGLVPPVAQTAASELWVYGPGAENPAMWRTTTALLRALRDEAVRHGARLVVLYVPVRFEVNDSVWDLTRARYKMGRLWKREKVFDRLQAACAELAVPLVDPRQALRAAEASPQPAYYTRDVHWNDVGNELAATAAEPAVRRALGCATVSGAKP
jgi:lysophospholipase L1-like esterase